MNNLDTEILRILLVTAWFIRSVGSTLSLLAIWQLKEYRFDRIREHLSTKQGKNLILNYNNLLKWFLLFSFPLHLFSEKYRLFFPIIVTAVFISESFYFILQKLKREFKRPKLTKKIKIILTLTLSMQVTLFVIAYSQKGSVNILTFNLLAMVCVTLDRALSSILAFFVLLLNPLSSIVRKWIIRKARRKVKTVQKLKVIGITGSYGKSSTKEILSFILSRNYKVLKTMGSENTDIGVARTILTHLKKEHEIFVVEMGAYKLREIKAICDIVAPQIGVITAIGEQHLGLFKSKENILTTKIELVESLPGDGLAVLNGDLKILRAATENLPCRKLFFGRINEGLDIEAKDIVVAKRKIRFKIVREGEMVEVETQLLGRQNIPNVLAATLVAQELGFSLQEVAKALRKIKSPKRTMSPQKGVHGSIFIDDTFNVNPKGVAAALRYLKETEWHRRILVLQPLIELGEVAEHAHMRLGTLAANICDKVYLTNDNYRKYLLMGVEQSKNKNADFIWLNNRKQIASRIHDELEKHDVVLFEGKEAERVIDYLKKHKYG